MAVGLHARARLALVLAIAGCGSGTHDPIGKLGDATPADVPVDAAPDAIPIDASPPPNPTYLKASNTRAFVMFGTSAAISADGSTLVIGEPGDQSSATGINGNQADTSKPSSGAAYVYVRAGGAWAQQAYVKASNPDAYDHFGKAVALSGNGDTLVVGAVDEASASTGIGGDQTDNSADRAGAAYVFVRNGTTWTQQAYVKAASTTGTGGGTGDAFGNAVAISDDGNTLAVAAYGEDSAARGVGGDPTDNAASDSGAVYVFTRSGTTWSQQAYVKASNTDAYDVFGVSVSLTADGNWLAVGAYSEASMATGVDGDQTDNHMSGAGAVYTFSRSGTTWTQDAYLKASNTYNGMSFGACVAWSADGTTLAVGSEDERSAATGVGGDQLDRTLSGAGAVYVLTHASGYTQTAYIKASNTGNDDRFGRHLALSSDGNTLVVGAFNEDSSSSGIDGNQNSDLLPNSGAAYLFQRAASTWSQLHYVKAPNPGYEDNFGGAIASSATGKTLVVGAPQEWSAATGVNGNQADDSDQYAGAAYVFEW